jgi:hypothetical protein
MQGQQVYPAGLFLLPRREQAECVSMHPVHPKSLGNYFQTLRRPSVGRKTVVSAACPCPPAHSKKRRRALPHILKKLF